MSTDPGQGELLPDPRHGQHLGQLALTDMAGGTRPPDLVSTPDAPAPAPVRCRQCHRRLTDPVSRRWGIGPDCAQTTLTVAHRRIVDVHGQEILPVDIALSIGGRVS